MGKKKTPKAPEYQNTTYNTGGLFGDTTTTKEGTTFNPNNSMSTIGNMAWQGLGNSLNNLNRTDFSKDKNYQVYSNNLQRQMRDNFNNNVLSGIANNGLMRSSGLQAATNAFNDTLANQTANLYDSYYNRQAQSLANYQNTLNNLYNYLSGVSGLGMNANGLINDFNRGNYQNKLSAYQNSGNSGLWGTIANAAGSLGGPIANSLMGNSSPSTVATSGGGDLTSTIAAAAPFLMAASDIRVKKNIKPLGEENGYKWYEFEYKDGYGLPKGKQTGVIAQEVEKIKPEAVTEINGIKHVDYAKL